MINKNELNSLTTLESFENLSSNLICICDLTSGAMIDIQLSSTSNLAYGSIDVDLSIPSLQIKLKSTNISTLLQVYFFTILSL